MSDEKYREGISEVLAILECSEPIYTEKIPKKLMEFFKENCSKTYYPKIDSSKKIKEMNLLPETKGLLSLLYMDYWANFEEKEEFKNILKENQKKYDDELREKYNPDKIFEKQSSYNVNENKVEENVRVKKEESLVEYKENFIKKIFEKIKSFIRNFLKN